MLDHFISDIVDHLPSAVVVCATDGEIKKYNRRAIELWGDEPAPGQKFSAAYKLYTATGEHITPEQCPLAESLRTKVGARNKIVVFERKDNSRVTVLSNVELIGECGAAAVFQDILTSGITRNITIVNEDDNAASCVAKILNLRGHNAFIAKPDAEIDTEFVLAMTPEIKQALTRRKQLEKSLIVALQDDPETLKEILGE